MRQRRDPNIDQLLSRKRDIHAAGGMASVLERSLDASANIIAHRAVDRRGMSVPRRRAAERVGAAKNEDEDGAHIRADTRPTAELLSGPAGVRR